MRIAVFYLAVSAEPLPFFTASSPHLFWDSNWQIARVKRRQRTHAASGGASEALPHEVGARPSRSEPKLNTHALYPSRSELRGITFKNKKEACGGSFRSRPDTLLRWPFPLQISDIDR
jgi:hypothetical protein